MFLCACVCVHGNVCRCDAQNQQRVCRCVLTGVCVCVSEEARGAVAAVSCFSRSLPEKSIPDAAELLSPPLFHPLTVYFSLPSSLSFFIFLLHLKEAAIRVKQYTTSHRTFYPIPQVVFSH